MRIYLAGKIAANDWRHTIVYRLKSGYTSDDLQPWPILYEAIEDEHDYTGPYFVTDRHTSYHGPNSHGVGADVNPNDEDEYRSDAKSKEFVIHHCREAIDESDLVFAWIDAPDAYGTIAEISYAQAIGVTVHIAGPIEFQDLWFVYRFCSDHAPDFKHETAKDALDSYLCSRLRSMPYQDYLQTPHWKKTRTAALERAHHRCQVCNGNYMLQVHHRTYERRGNEQSEDLIVLCDACHEVFHKNRKLTR